MLSNYLIGLREGLEAALVVSILVAYLVRTDRRHALPWVWVGVGVAVGLSVLTGALLEFTAATLSERAEEIFAGTMSFLAVGFVTWMIFWMRTAGRTISSELRGQVDRAVQAGIGAIVGMTFIAVAREGLETAVFFFAAARAAGSSSEPLLGFVLGLGSAVLLGWLLYRRAISVDLARFFRITGILLIFVAAGVLAYGIHEFQEAGLLPGEDRLAFDVSGTIAEDSWVGTLMAGIFNISPAMSVLQVVAWVGYVGIALPLFLRPVRRAADVPAAAAPATAVATAAPA
ncbi:MAG TPA: iron uptake transporter permease EfeU, partial [Candidatus Nanopelagicales bacterium]